MSSHRRLEMAATAVAGLLGLAWGLFWIPMRRIDAVGLTGPWATVTVYFALAVLVLPLWLWRGRAPSEADRAAVVLAGIAGGLSLALYATAFLYTDVIRAILLYYMTPVWSALMERVFFGRPLGPARLLALVSGLTGLCLVLGVADGFPLPRNLGDWMALGGGVFWSVMSIAIYRADRPEPLAFASWNALAAVGFSLALALLAGTALPEPAAVLPALPWVLLLAWGLILGSTLLVPWTTRHAGPTRIGLMYMLETPVAGFTAAWLTEEHIGMGEILGAALIMAAALLDTVWGQTRPTAPAEPPVDHEPP